MSLDDMRRAIRFGLVDEDEVLIQCGSLADVLEHAAGRARAEAVEQAKKEVAS